MASDDGGGLRDFVTGRYAELRRSAYLMCGDWALADDLSQKSLARLVAVSRRTTVDDPDAFVYSHLMATFQRQRQRRRPRRHPRFVTAPRPTANPAPRATANPAPRATANPAPRATANPAPRATANPAPPSPPVSARHRSCGLSNSEEPKARKIAEGQGVDGVGDSIRTTLVLGALRELAPRCRAVLVLRHWDGFSVAETADMLGLADERVDAYEAAGLAALDYLLAGKAAAR
jgi:RNA polymerase sigma factor (sigma-70 family)